jgi:hypothetical protein
LQQCDKKGRYRGVHIKLMDPSGELGGQVLHLNHKLNVVHHIMVQVKFKTDLNLHLDLVFSLQVTRDQHHRLILGVGTVMVGLTFFM